MIPIIDALNDGLEATLRDDQLPLCIRHGADRALHILNKYYDKTDASHIPRFSMSTFNMFCAVKCTDLKQCYIRNLNSITSNAWAGSLTGYLRVYNFFSSSIHPH